MPDLGSSSFLPELREGTSHPSCLPGDAGLRDEAWDHRGHGDSEHAPLYQGEADIRDALAVFDSVTQLDALTPTTDLVTLGIGGNDGRVFGTLVTTCVGLALKDPDGSPCADLGERPGSQVRALVAGMPDTIEAAVEAIQRRAPQARVVVVGYPQIFPGSGTCDERLPLASGDVPYARDLMRRIATAQEQGARAAGAEYVDLVSATEGHDICSDDPWVAGIVPERPALAYHPYAEEQQAVARLLKELLTS